MIIELINSMLHRSIASETLSAGPCLSCLICRPSGCWSTRQLVGLCTLWTGAMICLHAAQEHRVGLLSRMLCSKPRTSSRQCSGSAACPAILSIAYLVHHLILARLAAALWIALYHLCETSVHLKAW